MHYQMNKCFMLENYKCLLNFVLFFIMQLRMESFICVHKIELINLSTRSSVKLTNYFKAIGKRDSKIIHIFKQFTVPVDLNISKDF